jgi:hypothetical protein
MPSHRETFPMGIEEEYQIIDPVTYELSSSSIALLPTAQRTLGEKAQPELQLKTSRNVLISAFRQLYLLLQDCSSCSTPLPDFDSATYLSIIQVDKCGSKHRPDKASY